MRTLLFSIVLAAVALTACGSTASEESPEQQRPTTIIEFRRASYEPVDGYSKMTYEPSGQEPVAIYVNEATEFSNEAIKRAVIALDAIVGYAADVAWVGDEVSVDVAGA